MRIVVYSSQVVAAMEIATSSDASMDVENVVNAVNSHKYCQLDKLVAVHTVQQRKDERHKKK